LQSAELRDFRGHDRDFLPLKERQMRLVVQDNTKK
jgi:hypothetical protein